MMMLNPEYFTKGGRLTAAGGREFDRQWLANIAVDSIATHFGRRRLWVHQTRKSRKLPPRKKRKGVQPSPPYDEPTITARVVKPGGGRMTVRGHYRDRVAFMAEGMAEALGGRVEWPIE